MVVRRRVEHGSDEDISFRVERVRQLVWPVASQAVKNNSPRGELLTLAILPSNGTASMKLMSLRHPEILKKERQIQSDSSTIYSNVTVKYVRYSIYFLCQAVAQSMDPSITEKPGFSSVVSLVRRLRLSVTAGNIL